MFEYDCNEEGKGKFNQCENINALVSPYPWVPRLWIQPAIDQNYWNKISRKFPEGKFEFATHLHITYNALGIIVNLKMI